MVRHLALFGETAYDSVLINGMVLGSDGRKMSKSLGNFVASPEVFEKYGSDASRLWAATGGSTGTDIPFRWADVEYGWRFMRKLWNACRFASMRLEGYEPGERPELKLLDRWILSELEEVVGIATKEYEACNFMNAVDTARNFIWHIFCDHYLEAAKHRLYGEGPEKTSAQWTLHYSVSRMLQLLAPTMPHITEEIYSTMYAEDESDSIHVGGWPEVDESLIDEDVEKRGDLIVAVIRDIRREKNRLGIPLNTPIEDLELFAENPWESKALAVGLEDITKTMKAETLEIRDGGGGEFRVDGYPGVSFSFASQTGGT
jgi:valyl-tRNA synthetase